MLIETLTTERHRLAVLRATVTRGPRKGLLRSAPPPASSDPDGYAAWNAIHAAQHAATWGALPDHCGIGGMIMHGGHDVWEPIFDAALDLLRTGRPLFPEPAPRPAKRAVDPADAIRKHERKRRAGKAGPYCGIDWELMRRDPEYSAAEIAERQAFNAAFAAFAASRA